jgi:threonine synthase
MGPPGAGKTSVARSLSRVLNMPAFDIDNDLLEPLWHTSVAHKLHSLGEQHFLSAEAAATRTLHKTRTIISLTGSNPLDTHTMTHIASLGKIVFLDVPHKDIIDRMQAMKVDRIVGQAHKPLASILEWRNNFYQARYDHRILVEQGASVEQITKQVLDAWNKDEAFISTRGSTTNFTFDNVIKNGLAPDGGLFVPRSSLPKFSNLQLKRLVDLNFTERALRVLERLPIGNLIPSELRNMLENSYLNFTHTDILPVRHFYRNQYLLETFHGPTASFKDFSLQLFPKILKSSSEKNGLKNCLLVATSGDTGSAMLDGFRRSSNLPAIVLYPKNGVSPIQELQMRSYKGCLVLGIDSDFDFCQGLVKEILENDELNSLLAQNFKMQFTSANSINWGRLFSQIFFSFSGYLDLAKKGVIQVGDEIDVAIPTGNFGNILASFYAKEMGLPIRKLYCVSNENNVLYDFLETGTYDLRQRTLSKTHSPSVDILISSNLERLVYEMLDKDHEKVNELFYNLKQNKIFEVPSFVRDRIAHDFVGKWCDQSRCLSTIANVYNRQKEIIDPHTALAVHGTYGLPSDIPMLIFSTAHYGKFPSAISNALALPQELSLNESFATFDRLYPGSVPSSLKSLVDVRPNQHMTLSANAQLVKAAILDYIKSHKY